MGQTKNENKATETFPEIKKNSGDRYIKQKV
jgi:hypothetical protein